eukprot:8177197-Pyramimonas_sp.AAC.1
MVEGEEYGVGESIRCHGGGGGRGPRAFLCCAVCAFEERPCLCQFAWVGYCAGGSLESGPRPPR